MDRPTALELENEQQTFTLPLLSTPNFGDNISNGASIEQPEEATSSCPTQPQFSPILPEEHLSIRTHGEMALGSEEHNQQQETKEAQSTAATISKWAEQHGIPEQTLCFTPNGSCEIQWGECEGTRHGMEVTPPITPRTDKLTANLKKSLKPKTRTKLPAKNPFELKYTPLVSLFLCPPCMQRTGTFPMCYDETSACYNLKVALCIQCTRKNKALQRSLAMEIEHV
jgi:hypothetical protein